MYTHSQKNVGEFQNAETGIWFTFEDRPFDALTDSHIFLYNIHMSDGTTRDARVMKTVVHVNVDEDEFGNPVIERWKIKNLSFYSKRI